MKPFACAALFAASIAAVPNAADATVTIDITQVGTSVVATGSGSLNLTGLIDYERVSQIDYAIDGSEAFAEIGDGDQWMDGFTGLASYPTSFGSGHFISSSSVTGGPFGVDGAYGFLWLPEGYVSGSPISGTATWLNQSIASLGLTPGTYSFVAPADSVVVNIEGEPAVPEPASWAMMLLGLSGIGFAMRRRRRLLVRLMS